MRFLSLRQTPVRIGAFSIVLSVLLVFPQVAFLQQHLNPPTRPTSIDELRLMSNSNSTGFADIVFVLGNSGDFPIAGNWNGLP